MLFKIVILLDSEEVDSDENIDVTDDMSDVSIIDQLKRQKVLQEDKTFSVDRKNGSEIFILSSNESILLLRRNKKFFLN